MQCCTCSKWVHVRCSQLSLSKSRALGSSHSWSCPPCRNTVTLLYTSTVQSGPPSTDAAPSSPNLLSPIRPFCVSFLRPLLLAALLRLLTLSGFFSGMLEIFEPGALNYFTFSRPTLSTLSASRNPILTHLPLSGFLHSLFCVLIVLTPGLAFCFLMLAAVLSFSSGRAYPSPNFPPPLFLRSIPTLIM